MSDNNNSVECNAICWGIAALVGFVAMVMLYMLAEFSALQAIFTGGLIGTLLGVVLSVFVCRGPKTPGLHDDAEKPAQRYAREAAEDQARRGVPAPAGMSDGATADGPGASSGSAAAPAAASSTSSAVLPSKELPGQAELAARKGDWKYESDAAKQAASAVDRDAAIPSGETAGPADAPVERESAVVDKGAAIASGETAAPAVAPAAESAEESAPTLYDSAPSEGADDLKRISGVGPKLEETLNDMGIYRFDQVAAWGPGEIAWVDNRLRFKGRIERDDWMSQAKKLAAGE